MNLSALQGDEKLFLRRIEDLSNAAASKGVPRFSLFLDERRVMIAESFIRQSRVEGAMLFGGYCGAARKVCGFFPIDGAPDENFFPIVPVTARFGADKDLTHRDFLGSLMALGIKRESVGDICAGRGACTFFVLESVAGFISSELKKVGNTGVTLETGTDASVLNGPEFVEIRGTVSSPRLDSLVRLAASLSREKAAALIKGGFVRKNHADTDNVSEPFSEGDTVSIRGYGRFLVDSVGLPGKKGRLPVLIKKYV